MFPDWTNDSSVANSCSSRMKSDHLIQVTIAIKCTSCFIKGICLTSHRIMILWLGLWFFRSSFSLYCVRMHQPIRMNVWNEKSIKNIGHQPLFDGRDANDKNDNFIGNVWQGIKLSHRHPKIHPELAVVLFQLFSEEVKLCLYIPF